MKQVYKAFISYARDPDAALAADLETFLESLDRNSLIEEPFRTSHQ